MVGPMIQHLSQYKHIYNNIWFQFMPATTLWHAKPGGPAPGLPAAAVAGLRVVRASLHKGQQGASHDALGRQTQHVAEVPQSVLAHSQQHVAGRRSCCGAIVITSDGA